MAKRSAGLVKTFRGSFALHLMDLLRTITRDNQTLALKIMFREGREGTVYFVEGRLVHAEFKGEVGEDAMMLMLPERDGQYRKLVDETADVISIEADARTLLESFKTEEGAKFAKKESARKEPDKKEPAKKKAAKKEEADGGETDTFPAGTIEEAKIAGPPVVRKKPAEKKKSVAVRAWTPPPAPDRGFQEEEWMRDWGKNTPGFIGARIIKTDGTLVMQVAADDETESDPGALAALVDMVNRMTEGAGFRSMHLEMEAELWLIHILAEGYLLMVNADRSSLTNTQLISHVAPLVTALNTSLEKG